MAGTSAQAYNSWWQARSDAWSRLDEASSQLAGAAAQNTSIALHFDTYQPTDKYIAYIQASLASGTPVIIDASIVSARRYSPWLENPSGRSNCGSWGRPNSISTRARRRTRSRVPTSLACYWRDQFPGKRRFPFGARWALAGLELFVNS